MLFFPTFNQRHCLPFALLLGLCSLQADDAITLAAASPEKPSERKIAAPVPNKPAPATPVAGATTLAAPDGVRPLQYIAPNKKRVSQGELLALFENSTLHTAFNTARKELNSLKAATATAEAEATDLEAATGEKIATATFELRKAEQALSKYIEGDAPTAEITLVLALSEAEANFEQQTERYNVRDKMLEEGYIHKVEYDNEERLLKKTRLLRDAAKLKLDTFLKYDREQNIAQLTRTVNDKKAALEKTERAQEAAIAKAQRAIEACGKAETAKARECEELAKELAATIILAPREGVFTYPEGGKFTIGSPVTHGRILGTIK